MTQLELPVESLAQLLELPDSWVIFDVKSEDNEVWIFLKIKEMPSSNDTKTEILRHLDTFGKRTYIKLHFTSEQDLDELQFYTGIGFCKPFIKDVKKMLGIATDTSICSLYSLTKEELNKIKVRGNAKLLA